MNHNYRSNKVTCVKLRKLIPKAKILKSLANKLPSDFSKPINFYIL